MALDSTLAVARREAESGDLGKARDRLHGLLATYPDNLEVRRLLGDVYLALRFPSMAGRYFYLVPDKTPEMLAAVESFEGDCGQRATEMLRRLKFHGTLADPRSRDLLTSLRERAACEDQEAPRQVSGAASSGLTLSDEVLRYGCVLLFTMAIVLAIIGLVTVLRSLWG